MNKKSTQSKPRASSKELTPSEIRTIRQSLGLSQVEAGELLGGGPRAFSKYESGAIVPAASIANLLRLLEANPASLSTLTGRRANPINRNDARPFEVTGRHLAELTERQFASLLRRLLHAEALANPLPASGIHVAAKITVADGGEDGRIEWTDGPTRTAYLPARLCQFQLKAGPIGPTDAASDVTSKAGTLKPVIQEVLAGGGVYTMLSTTSYVGTQIAAREKAIRQAIASAGLIIVEEQVVFRDGDQVAQWVNHHPSVAAWVLEQTQPALLGPFRSWAHWAGRPEHDNSLWVDDPRLPELRAYVEESVSAPRGVGRLVGYSGVGKSRLALEALSGSDGADGQARGLCDLVLYAVESEAGGIAIKNAVQGLADAGLRAIVVIDRCGLDTHEDLSGMTSRAGSRLSILTIDDEIPPGPPSKNWFVLSEAPPAVTEPMIENIAPGLPSEDKRRLLKFSKGYPKIARLLGETWSDATPLAYATDEALVERILLGRRATDADLVKRAAMLLSVFGLVEVRVKDTPELVQIAGLGRNLQVSDLQAVIDELLARGVIQRRGRAIVVQPRPIALRLAERQWRQWNQDQWDQVLAGDHASSLKIRAAKQLALLNTTDVGSTVVSHVCRFGGPFDSIEAISAEGCTAVLSALAEVDGAAVVSLFERVLAGSNLTEIGGDARRHLVWALEKIAFDPNTFEEGARLLFELAAYENESWSNNATGQFAALFPTFLGDTAADGKARLRLLEDLMANEDAPHLKVLVSALLQGAKLDFFSRGVGSETHGSRPAMEPWRPETWDDAWAYVDRCVDYLIILATQSDQIGDAARQGLGTSLRTYVNRGRLDLVEKVVQTICNVHGRYWPEALGSLGDIMVYDAASLKDDESSRVKALIALLQPDDLADRVKLIITNMPWDYPCDEALDYEERGPRQQAAVTELADELLHNPELLREFLPQLCVGEQRMAAPFGEAIGERVSEQGQWLEDIKTALLAAEATDRNFGLLSGFLVACQRRLPGLVEKFKEEAVGSADFAPALPLICWRLDISESDITLICRAYNAGLIPTWALMQWTLGGVLAKLPAAAVAPLFDILLTSDALAYSIGLDLLGMYTHGNLNKLADLIPQLRLVAKAAGKWPKSPGSQMGSHHFAQLMGWALQNAQPRDANALALILAQQLVKSVENGNSDLIETVLSKILSDFSEIVWLIIGKAIVSDKLQAWKLEHVLGDTFSFRDEQNPPILSLSEDALFAWCHAYPDTAPAFLAVVAPVLTSKKIDDGERSLHPVMRRLIDEFGERNDVLRGIHRNMHSYGWTGSRTTYYALYDGPIRALMDHPKGPVRRWAKSTLQQLNAEIASARDEDEEHEAQYEV